MGEILNYTLKESIIATLIAWLFALFLTCLNIGFSDVFNLSFMIHALVLFTISLVIFYSFLYLIKRWLGINP